MPQLEYMMPPTTSDSPSRKKGVPIRDDWSEGWRVRLAVARALQRKEGANQQREADQEDEAQETEIEPEEDGAEETSAVKKEPRD